MAYHKLFSIIFALLLVFQVHGSVAYKPKVCYINAIYSLGDSITDTGNLLHLGLGGSFTPIANFPYGQTIHKATGRCSDGLLIIDYLAEALNLPLINPYLEKDANFDNGVNFAVAGATALESSTLLQKGILAPYTNASLSVQLDWFKTYLNSKCTSKDACEKMLDRALITLGEIGGNDYNYAFFEGKQIDEVKNLVPLVVQKITNTAKELIEIGAKHIVVPGNFPIGCMPSYLSAFGHNTEDFDDFKCLKSFNSFAMIHNEKLQASLAQLRETYPHVQIMYADYFHAFMHLLEKASLHGFEKDSLMKACCGAGGKYNFDATKICGAPGTSVCENPSNHISWDGIHLTQEAYKVMAKTLISPGGFIIPSYGVQGLWKCY
ncbi:GDSL esterase/lipase At1g28650-like [Dioscorea cayenensis subsp. rotundata]|uniref:GDSL esterase/lipase At1g28650-like n=1 Tax=Dioscorea cayennensis subsp. rotundata TaxID=55577 RepID=A0AB40BXN6_DIOCR|nr:GDSL esterase/lipase At1g28650-like [Dioscorea cayenensis subsp. rotundata]